MSAKQRTRDRLPGARTAAPASRTARPLLVLAAWIAVALPSHAQSQPASARLDGVLPDDTLAWISLDVAGAVAEAPGLALVELFRDEEVQDFLKPLLDRITAEREWREFQAALFMARSYGLPQVIAGRVSVGLLGVGVESESGMRWYSAATPPEAGFERELGQAVNVIPDLVIGVDTSGREAFGSSIGRLLELDPGWVTRQVDREGVSFHCTTFDDVGVGISVYHAFSGDRFIMTTREERMVEILGSKWIEGSLASDPAYRRWREIGPRASSLVEVYLAARRCLDAARPLFGEREAATLDALGIDGVRGFGVSLGVEQGRFRDAWTLVVDPRRPGLLGLLSAFEPLGEDEGTPPGDAALLLRLGVDAGALFDGIVRAVTAVDPHERRQFENWREEAREFLGFDPRGDLLASLGTDLRVWATMPRSGFVPGVMAAMQLRDPPGFSACLERLIELARENAGGFEIRDLEMDGAASACSVRIEGAPVSPSLCVTGDRFLAAESPQAIRRMLRSGGGEPEGRTPDFALCLETTTGGSLGDVAALYYLDLPAVARYGLGLAGLFLPALLEDAPVELDPASFPMPETVADYLSGDMIALRVGSDYASLESSSTWMPVTASVFGVVVAGGQAESRRRAAIAEERARIEAERAAAEALARTADDAFLGVRFDTTDTRGGILVSALVEGAPAQRAGIEVGDRVTAIDGKPVATPGDLTAALREHEPGDSIVVRLVRGGEIHTFPVTLARRGDFDQR